MTHTINGTIRMTDGTTRPARMIIIGDTTRVEFAPFVNANGRASRSRKASEKQAATFAPNES